MKYLPKVLIANFVLFSAAVFADYSSTHYATPIHQDGRMPDGTKVYEQNIQSAPQSKNWIYDPSVSSQWRPTDSLPAGQNYPTAFQGNDSDRPSNWTNDAGDYNR